MKKTNVQLTTAGNLLKDMRRYEKKRWDLSVVAWTDDDRTFGVVGVGKDKDGDFQIVVEEIDEVLEGIWTVADVISSLEDISKETRVYLAGDGLYLAIDSNGSSIFTEADDDDAVGCWVTVIGEYEHEPQPESNKKREIHAEAIALLLILVAAVCWFGYNIYAMIAGVGGPLWEKILGIVVCCIVIVVSGCTLYYSKK
jgi:hypothetical protein